MLSYNWELHDGASHLSNRLLLIGSGLRQFVEHLCCHVVILVAILSSHAYVIIPSEVPLISPEQKSGHDIIGLRNTRSQ